MNPLAPGTKLGPYEIAAPIGAGGMGTVYRARDSRLGRDVAIKVASERFSERFEREARAVAALNHPNISTLFDIGPDYLVMELVEGETLAERIRQGPIPLDEVLRLASQIAEALAAAHEKGIVHRDLKPGNVMVKADGSVKVLDFGLAKHLGSEAGEGQQAQDSPTLSQLATQAGVILGTAAYMAPEQARGRRIDRRADIWAFGVVLYEMLTGKRLFQGEDLSETMAAVIMKEPDLEPIPPQVRRLVRRCLEKDPHKRLHDMGSVMLLLEDGSSPSLATQLIPPIGVPPPGPKGVPRWAWGVMGALGLSAVIATAYAVRPASSPADTPASVVAAILTLDLAPAEMLGPALYYNRPSRTGFAMSPDGTTIVYVGDSTSGATRTSMLYRRPLADPQATPIPGTEGAEYPFFSPDGQWVGFAAGPKLKKVAITGGPPLDICDLPGRIEGASWATSGTIVFARQGVWIVPDSGGKLPEILVERSPESRQFSPVVLPDGQTVLFTEIAGTDWEQAHVDAIDVTTRQRKTLLTNAADARYSPTGHLVFMRSGALLAVPFDGVSTDIVGAPVPLLADVMHSINAPNSNAETGMGQYAISASGTLLYASGGIYPVPSSTMVQVDRKGVETRLVDIKGGLGGVRVSRDGKRVVASVQEGSSRANDIWQYGLPAGTPTRVTSNGLAAWPLWAADGQGITITQGVTDRGIYAVPIGGGTPQPILAIKGGFGITATSWSPDGKWLAYLQVVNNVTQIFVQPMADGKPAGEPRQFAPSPYVQRDAEFSPDGRWIAYGTNESGAFEIYVQPFPGPGEKQRISLDGGFNPVWSPKGQAIYYLKANPGARSRTATQSFSLMAANISTSGEASGQQVLFEGPYGATNPLRSYDVTPDGQFIMIKYGDPPDQRVTNLHVVLGWGEELRRRVPPASAPSNVETKP